MHAQEDQSQLSQRRKQIRILILFIDFHICKLFKKRWRSRSHRVDAPPAEVIPASTFRKIPFPIKTDWKIFLNLRDVTGIFTTSQDWLNVTTTLSQSQPFDDDSTSHAKFWLIGNV